jgi:hypothetical protein
MPFASGDRIDEMYLPLTQEHVGDAVCCAGLREEGMIKFHYRVCAYWIAANCLTSPVSVNPVGSIAHDATYRKYLIKRKMAFAR